LGEIAEIRRGVRLVRNQLSNHGKYEVKDTREKIDVVKLNAEIEEIVAREQVLRDEIARIIAEIEV